MSKENRVALIVLDGWGIAPRGKYNAVSQARTPNLDKIKTEFGSTPICASGTCVGLTDGQMGNSEVGHLTIGAGRVIFQDLMRVTREIKSGRLAKNRILRRVLARVKTSGGTLHLLGLVSDGGVHSHIDHLYALLEIAKHQGMRNVAVHVILDGRDTPPKSGIGFVKSLQSTMKKLGVGYIATVSGRYYAMDRDNRWDRTKLAYDAIMNGKAEKRDDDPRRAILSFYSDGVTDEFVRPTVIGDHAGVEENDAVFFFNFRPDRARQLTKAITQTDREFGGKFDRGHPLRNPEMITMTVYDPKLKRVKAILGREHVSDTLGDVLEENRISQMRIAETEKYAHVTYFFNGLEESPRKLEKRILVPSAKEVGTYDKKPEMSAGAITENALDAFKSLKYGFILVNYANADMVGHSGNIRATVQAIESVDSSLGKIYDEWKELGDRGHRYDVFVTADHGNSEKMYDPRTRQPHTAHTSNPVPLILMSSKWRVKLPSRGYRPGLIDIAPSVLRILGLKKPRSMSGKPIVHCMNNS